VEKGDTHHNPAVLSLRLRLIAVVSTWAGLPFAAADWPTASDGKEPFPAVGRTGAFDPVPT